MQSVTNPIDFLPYTVCALFLDSSILSNSLLCTGSVTFIFGVMSGNPIVLEVLRRTLEE